MSTSGAASWSNYVPTGILLIAIIGGFWQLADPRAELRDIKTNYLSLREHDEFVRRFTADIARIERENREQDSQLVTKGQFDLHDKNDEKTYQLMVSRLAAMQAQIDLLMNRSLIQPPPNATRSN
jgi:hypothetical protein